MDGNPSPSDAYYPDTKSRRSIPRDLPPDVALKLRRDILFWTRLPYISIGHPGVRFRGDSLPSLAERLRYHCGWRIPRTPTFSKLLSRLGFTIIPARAVNPFSESLQQLTQAVIHPDDMNKVFFPEN